MYQDIVFYGDFFFRKRRKHRNPFNPISAFFDRPLILDLAFLVERKSDKGGKTFFEFIQENRETRLLLQFLLGHKS